MHLYLFQLGDNGLEGLFSLLRTLTHQRNMDAVQYQDNVSIVGQVGIGCHACCSCESACMPAGCSHTEPQDVS